jgi:hypothetical protein
VSRVNSSGLLQSLPSAKDTGEMEAVPANRFVVQIPEVTNGVVSLEGIDVIEDKHVTFNLKLAEEFHSLPRFQGERPFRRSHVIYLTNCFRRGTFLFQTVIIMTCQVGKNIYRINGQHTAAMVRSLAAIDPSVAMKVRFMRFKAKDMEMMRALYTSIDRNAPRTVGNQVIAQMVGTPGFESVPTDILRRLAEGVSLMAFESSHQRREHDSQDRVALLSGPYKSAALHICRILAGGTKPNMGHMLRSPVIAAMFATYRKSITQSDIFWKGVRDGESLRGKNNPILRTRDYLMNSGISDRGSTLLKKKVPAEKMFRQCILNWAAFREKRDVVHMKAPMNTKTRPVVV